MSRLSGQHRLFSGSKARPAGQVLELVSYWDKTVLDVDHIQTKAAAKVGEIISLSDSGCTLHLLPDMQARLKKRGGTELESTDKLIHVGKDDVVHIKQGNLDFVLMFVQIPTGDLPQISKRDTLYWMMLLASMLLYLVTASFIYLTKITPVVEQEFVPWFDPGPKREVSIRRPDERLVEKLEIKQELLPKPVVKPAAPPVVPPPAVAPKAAPSTPKTISKAQEGKAAPIADKPQASAPAKPGSGEPGRLNLSELQKRSTAILDRLGSPAAPIGFRDSNAGVGGNSGSGRNTLATPGINSGEKLGTSGAGDVSRSVTSGTGLGDTNIGRGFEEGRTGGGRADVTTGNMDPVTGGGLRADEVQRVIRANLNPIRHCYEKLLQRSPQAGGKLKVNFVIGGTGGVSSARILSDSVGDPELANCVIEKVLRWNFPAPRDAQQVNVNYPFTFNPR